MTKRYSVFITVLFCLFLFGFGAAHFLLPDQDFSQQENRSLSLFKAPTLDTVYSGKFMSSFEDYITDQFPLRDQWIRLKARSEKTLLKTENNKVYFGTDGQTLFAHFNALSDTELEKRVGYVNKLANGLDVPVYFGLIPDKSCVWANRLPDNAPNVDDGSTLRNATVLCDGPVWVDIPLSGDDVFYRTDHHWSTMGALQGYRALARAMGLPDRTVLSATALPLVLRSDSFYGTTWSACGAGWVKPDELYTMVPEGGSAGQTAVTRFPEGTPVPGSLYDLSRLEVKDKYSMFLGGNQPLCVIENPVAQGGKLLVVRDSYADSLAPFLSESWREVHLFDLRYNRTSIGDYVAENGIDQVLVLYSAANFSTDNNLVLLGRG